MTRSATIWISSAVAICSLFGCQKSETTTSAAEPKTDTAPIASASAASAKHAAPTASAGASAAPIAGPSLTVKDAAMPSGSGNAGFDYIAYDEKAKRVWVPMARDVGSVDVYDIAKNAFTRVGGFPLKEQERDGKKRTAGPSAVTLGDGFAYVGNRATSEVCAVDAKTLAKGSCLALTTPTDGVSYVAATKEVWVTTPRDKTITVLDASKPDTLKTKTTIKLEGSPEGYAVDDAKGLFYSNLEDKDRTLVIDAKTHTVRSTWNPGCGEDGPRGLAIDAARGFLMVACTDHLVVMDVSKDGAIVAKTDTGGGVDNIDYAPSKKLLVVASGKTGRLTSFRIDDRGQPSVAGTAATADRARNAVADADGNAYLIDPAVPRLLIVAAPKL